MARPGKHFSRLAPFRLALSRPPDIYDGYGRSVLDGISFTHSTCTETQRTSIKGSFGAYFVLCRVCILDLVVFIRWHLIGWSWHFLASPAVLPRLHNQGVSCRLLKDCVFVTSQDHRNLQRSGSASASSPSRGPKDRIDIGIPTARLNNVRDKGDSTNHGL